MVSFLLDKLPRWLFQLKKNIINIMNNLADRKCIPCHDKSARPLSGEKVSELLKEVRGWSVVPGGQKIEKEWIVKDFVTAIKFLNEITDVAEEEGHHPDILIEKFNHMKVTFYTHNIGGLTENDFIMAAKVDRLFLWNR